jgi:hypothetical protein
MLLRSAEAVAKRNLQGRTLVAVSSPEAPEIDVYFSQYFNNINQNFE